jgi:FkbM family methyltransferase
MSFISYAQNFEDVMLWRALKHIEDGFYIDVGAWSPDIDSVTRAFYKRGWWGINVEPNPEFHSQLLTRRPRDINMRLAVSDKSGTQIMNFLSNPGLSTLDETIAQKHVRAGWTIDKQVVEVTTLAALWEQHVPEGQSVHFLKVDVEGFEEAALRGNDWSRYRPWIVVVEATLPMSQQESYDTWEPIILTAGYHFAYADGLNRYYVADEHAELLPAFKYPPNVFDDFKSNLRNQAEARANEAKVKAYDAEAEVHEAESEAYYLDRELRGLQASYCWRMTRPLRDAFDMLVRLRLMIFGISQKVKCGIEGQLGSIIARLINFVRSRPALKSRALSLVSRYPDLEARLLRFIVARGITSSGTSQIYSEGHYMPSTELSGLTPGACIVYTDLKAAIERHNRADQ